MKIIFLNRLFGFTPYWEYEPTNAYHLGSPGVYTTDKILYLITIDKLHLKCDVIDESVVNGLRQPIIQSFVLDKTSGYKVFCEPETTTYKKI